MTLTERELIDRLETIEHPLLEGDVVALGLVDDVTLEDGTARVSLAFDTPHAPVEMELGERIRETIEETGVDPDLRARAAPDCESDRAVLPNVRNVVAVASGKGGVGKTTVAANLAAGLERKGARVGVLDADVHGPNVPRILPIEDEPDVTPDDELVPPRSDGVRVMSMGLLTESDDDPAILRGPMVNNVMNHFLGNVAWGHLDYLVVDLPPGTGDASLDLLQTLPVTGVVIVTTPQRMAVDDARKGLRLFEEHDTPVVGVVENMSAFQCPTCGDDHAFFGTDGGSEIGEEYGVPVLPTLPLHPDFGNERGAPVVKDDESPVADAVEGLVDEVADRIAEINHRTVAADESGNQDRSRAKPP